MSVYAECSHLSKARQDILYRFHCTGCYFLIPPPPPPLSLSLFLNFRIRLVGKNVHCKSFHHVVVVAIVICCYLNNPNCDILFIAQLFTLCFIIIFNYITI